MITPIIDSFGHIVIDGEIVCHLTQRELQIVSKILTSNYTVTTTHLLDAIYGGLDEPDPKILQVYMSKIRKKLGPHRAMIETVWGRGWQVGPGYSRITEITHHQTVFVPTTYIGDLHALHPGKPLDEIIADLIKTHVKKELFNA